MIDTSVTPPIVWLVSKHEDRNSSNVKSYVQKLHGLYLTSLAEVPGSPLTITATGFDPWGQNQRAGLALFDNPTSVANVVVAWGSHCDSAASNYSGFVMEFDYNYSNLAFGTTTDVFNAELGSGAQQGGVWMAGGAPAVASGGIFLSVGNGGEGSGNYGNSVVKLSGAMAVTGSYTPNDAAILDSGSLTQEVSCGPTAQNFCDTDNDILLEANDWDLGSGGVVLLAASPNLSSPELIAAGKQGMLLTLYQGLSGADTDTSNQETNACDTTNADVVQCFQAVAIPSSTNQNNSPDWGSRSTPVFWGASGENLLFLSGVADVLDVYQLCTITSGCGTNIPYGGFYTNLTWSSSQTWAGLGATVALTWNSNGGAKSDAILWALDNHRFGNTSQNTAGPAQLFAYKAASSGTSVQPVSYTSSTSTTMPGAIKFTVPTIVDGKVIVGGGAPSYVINQGNCQAPWTGTTFQCGQLTILQ